MGSEIFGRYVRFEPKNSDNSYGIVIIQEAHSDMINITYFLSDSPEGHIPSYGNGVFHLDSILLKNNTFAEESEFYPVYSMGFLLVSMRMTKVEGRIEGKKILITMSNKDISIKDYLDNGVREGAYIREETMIFTKVEDKLL